MLKNYFKIAWRNLIKNKASSFINISGLAVGMAVSMLIGFWIYDELSYNKNFKNYDRIAAVMQHQTFNGVVSTQSAVPYLMGDELKKNYGGNFKYVVMASWTHDHILSYDDKKIIKSGNFFEPQVTDLLSLKMLKGTHAALQDDHSLIICASTAKALFGDKDPMNKVITIDNKFTVNVTGVYDDLAYNSDFKDLTFIAPWQLFINSNKWPEKTTNPWRNNSFQTYVQLAEHGDVNSISAKIKDAKLKMVTNQDAAFKPVIFLQPMHNWHLYSEFKNGINTGGQIEFVWLFGIIGFFVLLLACINFMNLSTARAEKRAKEVGIRKAVGSLRGQLISQFFCESIVVALIAFIICIGIVQLALPYFNDVANKKLNILWSSPLFWITGILNCLFTGLLAGVYPALYLSSFKPVKVLKGTFRAGRFAALPRKILIVLQFMIATILIIGTIVVYQQIQYAKSRPVGYNRNGLLTVPVITDDIHKHFASISNELKANGAIAEMAESSGAVTYINEFDNGFDWKGKDPSLQGDFGAIFVSPEFGKTVSWHIKDGRDFSKSFTTDSTAIILNEASVKFMGLKNPLNETIKWDGKPFHVIGIIKDMVMQSPYEPVFRSVFIMDKGAQSVINIRINPSESVAAALNKIQNTFKKLNPAQPFSYKFVDEQYAQKFDNEERIGKLAKFFTLLAIFISCLGLTGMASFMAAQRTKEIGVRKVLGATILGIWSLISKEFVVLISISLLLAMPTAYYFMYNWLQVYKYHSELSWWIFAQTGIGAIAITLLTVSYQSIKAALTNPIKSLRSE